MEKQSNVVFRNVGQLYFPQSRVECHYSLTSQHHWTNSDWIGLFQVGWSSVKEYYTFAWALAPEGYTGGTDVNYCVPFQAFYLPRPSATEYQFVYVDEKGKVCAQSRHFTFCAPKPLDELETLEAERDEEEEDEDAEKEDLLLVVPRAQLLQSRLDQCLREQEDLKQALEVVEREKEGDKEKTEEAEKEWEREREERKDEITELRENLRRSWERLEKMEGTNKDVQCSQETLSTEMSGLLNERAESQQQIRELEDDITALTHRGKDKEAELEKMKERVKKMSVQRRDEEERRKSLQIESQAALEELRGLQERLEASERGAESLRREMSELGAQQGHTHAELHQARLQAAQFTLQLSESNLGLREGRANWAQEREAFKQAAEIDKERVLKLSREVQLKEEWLQEERMEREKLEVELGGEKDCNRVQLSDARREVQELKASLRMVQKEREQHQLEKEDLKDYMRQLEQRLEAVADAKWSEAALSSTTPDSSSEDEKPASPLPPQATRPLSESHMECPQGVEILTLGTETNEQKSRQDKPLILPDLTNPILSELADSPLW